MKQMVWATALCILSIGCEADMGYGHLEDDGGLTSEGLVTQNRYEICDNGLDDDGDGKVDEGCACTQGDEQACYPAPALTKDVGACHAGIQQCAPTEEFASWGECIGAVTPHAEICGDELDNDCNGQVDDGCDENGSQSDGGVGNESDGSVSALDDSGSSQNPETCGPANCAGCCDNQGRCQPSNTTTCGLGGANCEACVAPEFCQAGQCAPPPCGPATCPDGCCDAQGTCQASKADTCGLAGAKCQSCVLPQQCEAGQCKLAAPVTYKVIAVNGRIDDEHCRKQILDYDHCDIYLKVWMGSQYGKTGTDGDSSSPDWNDLLFTTTDAELLANPMRIEFWDDDSLVWGSDDKVSSCSLTITAKHLAGGQITAPCDHAEAVTIVFQR
ncbi:MAG: hypothetical protein JRH20_02910 [Deltaproteobacteria bacterium]|nr:hypothetical protein [Deltaproteobacteria bacterium]